MEVSKYWRNSPASIGFRPVETDDEELLRYPGGEISLRGSIEEIEGRLTAKGFNKETVDRILFDIYGGGVASESPVALGEVVESFLELLRGEVREKDRSEVELRVNRLPR